MKRIAALLFLFALFLTFAGCGNPTTGTAEQPAEGEADVSSSKDADVSEPGNLLSAASPETSALMVFYYDGEQTTVRTLYDDQQEQAILDELNALPAVEGETDALSQWSLPCYGLWICNKDGHDMNVAWSDGLWLSQDGTVWQVDADFAGIWQRLEGEDEENGLSVLYFPNAGLLADYDARFLALVGEDSGISALPLEMYMTVLDVSDGVATVLIDNQSGYEMDYSEYYSLQMERDGQWYILPPKENMAFNDIAHILPDLESVTVTCDLSPYGALQAGHYRLEKDGMYAEFWLDEQGTLDERQDTASIAPEADITMEIFADSLSDVQVLLHNGTEEDAGYLWDFILWKLEGDSWVSVPFLDSVGICGVQDPLPAGETAELTLDFEALFGALEAGQYRLVMESEGWSAEFCLDEAGALVQMKPRDKLTLTVQEVTPGSLCVRLWNQSDTDIYYNGAYSILREVNGAWEAVEPLERIGICGIEDLLPAGEMVIQNLPLTPYYENLPAGEYLLSMYGCTASFTMPPHVSMTVDRVTEGTAVVTFYNPTEEEETYGRVFRLSRLEDGIWYQLDSKVSFTLEAYSLAPGESRSETVYLSRWFDGVGFGVYRLEQAELVTAFEILEDVELEQAELGTVFDML